MSATQYAALIPGWRQSCAPAVILLIYPTRSGRLYRPASRRRRPLNYRSVRRVRCDPLLAPDRLPIADAGHDLPWTARAEQRRCWPPTYSSQQQIVESHADPDFCPGRLRRRFRAEIASELRWWVRADFPPNSACPFATEGPIGRYRLRCAQLRCRRWVYRVPARCRAISSGRRISAFREAPAPLCRLWSDAVSTASITSFSGMIAACRSLARSGFAAAPSNVAAIFSAGCVKLSVSRRCSPTRAPISETPSLCGGPSPSFATPSAFGTVSDPAAATTHRDPPTVGMLAAARHRPSPALPGAAPAAANRSVAGHSTVGFMGTMRDRPPRDRAHGLDANLISPRTALYRMDPRIQPNFAGHHAQTGRQLEGPLGSFAVFRSADSELPLWVDFCRSASRCGSAQSGRRDGYAAKRSGSCRHIHSSTARAAARLSTSSRPRTSLSS